MCKLNELSNKQVDKIINEMLIQEVFAGQSMGAFQTLANFLKFLLSRLYLSGGPMPDVKEVWPARVIAVLVHIKTNIFKGVIEAGTS